MGWSGIVGLAKGCAGGGSSAMGIERREFIKRALMVAISATLRPLNVISTAVPTVERYWPNEYPWGDQGANILLRFWTRDPNRGLSKLLINETNYLDDPRAVAYIKSWFECRSLWDSPWWEDGDETEMDFRIEVVRPQKKLLFQDNFDYLSTDDVRRRWS